MRHLIPLILLLALLSCGNNEPLIEPEPIIIPESQPLYSISNSAAITFHVNDNGEVVIIIPAQELAEVLSPYLDGNDTQPPRITNATVTDLERNVNPQRINTSGIRVDFNEGVTGTIWITDENGNDLNWISAVALSTAALVAPHGHELKTGTTYTVHLNVTDVNGNRLEDTITFTTQGSNEGNVQEKDEDRIIIPDNTPPRIINGTVFNGQTNVNPMLINAGGLRFDFDEPITGVIWLTDETGTNLNWFGTVAARTASLAAVASPELEHATTYKVEMIIRDLTGNTTIKTITFTTLESNQQEGHINEKEEDTIIITNKNDQAPPTIVSSTIDDGEVNVDPEKINDSGIKVDFNEVVVGTIALTTLAGERLWWNWSVNHRSAILTRLTQEDIDKHNIINAEPSKELEHGKSYQIHIWVRDKSRNTSEFTITFTTKLKE